MPRHTEPRAIYSWDIEDGVVCIVDHDEGRSVTNDARNVIADIAAAGVDIDSTPIIYRDTEGLWDRLVVRDGEFYGFAAVSVTDRDVAIVKVLPCRI